MSKIVVGSFGIALVFAWAGMNAVRLTLVTDGRPNAVIVVETEPAGYHRVQDRMN